VPVADLNGDSRPDFVVVFGQEHETVEAFLNEGSGRFVRHSLETVQCDHPTLDLGDFDGDGAVDLVVGRFVDRSPKET
jgi:hypothetical protein